MSSNSYADNRARLNQYPGLFLENDQAYSSTYNYLQIRIEPYGRVVTAIAIQGYDKKWVSTYLISRSNDGKHFTYYMEKGHPMVRWLHIIQCRFNAVKKLLGLMGTRYERRTAERKLGEVQSELS